MMFLQSNSKSCGRPTTSVMLQKLGLHLKQHPLTAPSLAVADLAGPSGSINYNPCWSNLGSIPAAAAAADLDGLLLKLTF